MAALRIEDLEEERGGAVVLEVDRESTHHRANLRDLAPAAGHEDLVRASQSACCNQSSRGPLGGITSEKNRGKRIQEIGGIGAHSTSSREVSAACTPGVTARAAVTR